MEVQKNETFSKKTEIRLSESDVEKIVIARLIELGHIDERYTFTINFECSNHYFDSCYVSQTVEINQDGNPHT